MDLSKLSDVVSKEAKAEADQIIQTARTQSEALLNREKQLIEQKSKERIEEENNQYTSRLNYLRFNFESDFKKRVLHLKHSIMEDLEEKLYQCAVEVIKTKSLVYLGSVLSKSPVQQATLFVSLELENIISLEVLKTYNTASGSSFIWGGVDTGLPLGLAIEHGLVRYIFPLSESIQQFIQDHANEINDKFYS